MNKLLPRPGKRLLPGMLASVSNRYGATAFYFSGGNLKNLHVVEHTFVMIIGDIQTNENFFKYYYVLFTGEPIMMGYVFSGYLKEIK